MHILIVFFNSPISITDPRGDDPPKFDRNQFFSEAYKYNTIKDLHLILKPKENNWNIILWDKNPKTVSTTVDGEVQNVIFINNTVDIKDAVIAFAWEMTHAINIDLINNHNNQARSGEISKDQYIKGVFAFEAQAQINAMTCDDEMNGELSTKRWDDESIKIYNLYKNGTISKAGAEKRLAAHQYQVGQADAGDGKGMRPARDIYADQYDTLRQEAESSDQSSSDSEESTEKDSTETTNPSDSTSNKQEPENP